MIKDSHNSFLNIVRLGIGHSTCAYLEPVNWNEIKALADEQGLFAVVLDGIEALESQGATSDALPQKEMLTNWIEKVQFDYEYRYELYRRAIAELAGFYREHGCKMMVLKGYACSLDWPKPEHRPSGDIDIWQFGEYKKADALLTSEKGIEVDSSHHHHTVFYWRDFMVENHYDFINVHHHKSHKALEKILKEKAKDDSFTTVLYGETIYLPSSNLHALFLLKHMMLHFASGEIIIRQLLDWAFFIEKHSTEIDWGWFLSVLDDFHMREFFSIVNAICVDSLGFSLELFPDISADTVLKEKVLNEVLSADFSGDLPKKLINRVVYKFRRWKANEWKHKLCYKESMWSAFWYGLWNHLMKPSSI